jgi:hypothetical protein
MFKTVMVSISLAILLGSTITPALAKNHKSDQETQAEKDFYEFMRNGKQPSSSKLYHTPEASGATVAAAEEIQVPEPSTLALIGLGIAGLGFIRRKK